MTETQKSLLIAAISVLVTFVFSYLAFWRSSKKDHEGSGENRGVMMSEKISSKSSDDSLINAAFETKDGKIVLIVLNDGNKEVDFKVKFEDNTITSKLNAGAAATYVW